MFVRQKLILKKPQGKEIPNIKVYLPQVVSNQINNFLWDPSRRKIHIRYISI